MVGATVATAIAEAVGVAVADGSDAASRRPGRAERPGERRGDPWRGTFVVALIVTVGVGVEVGVGLARLMSAARVDVDEAGAAGLASDWAGRAITVAPPAQ